MNALTRSSSRLLATICRRQSSARSVRSFTSLSRTYNGNRSSAPLSPTISRNKPTFSRTFATMSSNNKNSSSGQVELKDKTIITVFGASGDLAKKMTFPSLFALFKDGLLPKDTKIVGYARSDLSKEKFQEQLTGGLEDEDKQQIDAFIKASKYVKGAYDEDEAFQNLEKELKGMVEESHRVYYLAVPPSQFTSLSEKLAKNNKTGLSNRLVIEKPFGKDTDSCKEMMKKITSDWKEDEIYRIDHFLGEEMVKAILHLRFANEHVVDTQLNKENVSSILIEWTETFGCEGRGGYFDEFGMIRDLLQNHFMQILTYLTMDKPESLEGDYVRDEKTKVLRAIKPIDIKDAILAQYTGDGKDKHGYLEDESVENKESKTETFAEMVVKIDNDRWRDVPILMRTAKAVDQDLGRVVVQFKQPKDSLFPSDTSKGPNELVIQLMPEHKITWNLNGKLPGMEGKPTKAPLELDYKQAYPNDRAPDAYEVVIREVLKGNETSFVREDELIAAWEIFTPLLKQYEAKDGPKPFEYKYGSKGPKEADEFEKKYGFVRQ